MLDVDLTPELLLGPAPGSMREGSPQSGKPGSTSARQPNEPDFATCLSQVLHEQGAQAARTPPGSVTLSKSAAIEPEATSISLAQGEISEAPGPSQTTARADGTPVAPAPGDQLAIEMIGRARSGSTVVATQIDTVPVGIAPKGAIGVVAQAGADTENAPGATEASLDQAAPAETDVPSGETKIPRANIAVMAAPGMPDSSSDEPNADPPRCKERTSHPKDATSEASVGAPVLAGQRTPSADGEVALVGLAEDPGVAPGSDASPAGSDACSLDEPVLGRKTRSPAQLAGWQRIGAQVENRKLVAQPGAPAEANASAESKVGSEPAVHKDLPLDVSAGRPSLLPLTGSTDGMPSLPLSTGHASDPTAWSAGQAVHTAADARLAAHALAHSPAHQVAVQLGRALDDGKTEIRIRLDPPDLGHVDIHMEFHDLRLAATIRADRPETLDLLQRDARMLTRAFRDAGVELSGSGLSFAHSGQGGHSHANVFDEWTTGFVRVPRDVRGGPALEHAAASYRSVLSIQDGRVDVRV